MIGIVARGASSALGDGNAALGVTAEGERPTSAITHDDELARAGFAKPFVARAALPWSSDRATVLLERALGHCFRELDASLPHWRSLRVGAAVGTSSGGMRAFDGEAPTLAGAYIGPLVHADRPVDFEPVSLVLGACASSTIAIGLGRAWLIGDRCDIAICGGFDDVSVFVAAGFECLRATCGARGPQPFRRSRDGLTLGEAAAFVALVRAPQRAHAWISGFAATCDATHLTAPNAQGQELARAARNALGSTTVGLVSAHGTATIHNDGAEANAILSVAPDVPVHSLKGVVGHTLGAAGALEVLSAITALERGVAPATAGEGPAEVRVLDRTEHTTARAALKLSSAFGGANAALVVGLDPVPGEEVVRDVFVSRAVHVTLADTEPTALAARTGYPLDRITRADDLVRLSLAAISSLAEPLDRETGIVIGHGLATIETNAKFHARLDRPEPRRFPYTTPNAAAGECAIAFGLHGPAFAVGGGPHGGIEAIGVAADLVSTGLAERIVVVAVDEAGPATAKLGGGTSGAVALVVSAAPNAGRLVSTTVRLERERMSFAPTPLGAHPALLPLASKRPERIRVAIPWGGFAEARFSWA